MTLLDEAVRPPPGAFAAEPFSLMEIDRHPDKDRIWATILVVREECRLLMDAAYAEGKNDQDD